MPWVFAFFNAIGQTVEIPEFKQQVFNSANGLSNSNVRVINKDQTGYLWIGTANGLSRFDGHFFTNFFHTPGDSNSLGHNFIQGIICDKDGKIWILHVLGLSLFNPENQYFTNFAIKEDYPHFSGGFSSFTEGFDGNIWIGNQNGLAVFNTREKRYLNTRQLNQFLFRADNGLAGTGINGIAKGENGRIWFNTYNRIFTWDPAQKQTLEINYLPVPGLNSSLAINYVDTSAGILYFGTFNKGLVVFHYKTNQWDNYRTGSESLSTGNYDPVRSLQPYGPNLDVFISELGIGFFDKAAGKLIPLKPVPFSTERVMLCLLADSSNIWAGTDNGLFLLTHHKIKPENITPPNRNHGSFNTVQVQQDEPFIYSGNYGLPAVYRMPAKGGVKTDLEGVAGYLRYYFKSSSGTEWLSTEDAIFRKIPGKETWKKVLVVVAGKQSLALLPRNFCRRQQRQYLGKNKECRHLPI